MRIELTRGRRGEEVERKGRVGALPRAVAQRRRGAHLAVRRVPPVGLLAKPAQQEGVGRPGQGERGEIGKNLEQVVLAVEDDGLGHRPQLAVHAHQPQSRRISRASPGFGGLDHVERRASQSVENLGEAPLVEAADAASEALGAAAHAPHRVQQRGDLLE